MRRRMRATHGWPPGYRPIQRAYAEGCPSAGDNALGRFQFYGRLLDLGSPPDWNPRSADRLWRFHLHYFDWVWAFVNHADNAWARDQFRGLWTSWRTQSRLGRLDAWSPYVASLRVWNMAGAFDSLVAGTDIEDEVLAQIRLHAGFIRWNLELDVGGNHLLKNAKALVGLGVFLGDRRLLRKGLRLERTILGTQILDDGGHFERSPSYHCQVLEDLEDLELLQASAGLEEPRQLGGAVLAMRSWLGSLLMPGGGVPDLNDSWHVSNSRLLLLRPIPDRRRLSTLHESGYVVVRPRPGTQLVLDVGPPGPADLPAHSQADALSFVVSVNNQRVIVDSGVSTYESSTTREYERSTRAHSTVEIDGVNQSEVWGVFRLGRRATVALLRAEDLGSKIVVSGFHDGYQRLPGSPIHHRTWCIDMAGIVITDTITGAGVHLITQRLVLAPGEIAVAAEGSVEVAGCIFATPTVNGSVVPWVVSASEVADGLGATQLSSHLTLELELGLPATLMMAIRFPPEGRA